MADWTQLPHELLEHIALKLDSLADFVVFSNICRPWNNVYVSLKESERYPKLMPWLLLSFNPNRNAHYDLDLFDPCKNKYYRFSLPEACNRRCWGTSLGWIMTLGLDLEIHLFNPLTKASLTLPPQHGLTPVLNDPNDMDRWKVQLHYIKRVFVFKSPIDGQLLVFVVHYDDNILSFVRPGDPSWTHVALRVSSSVDEYSKDELGSKGNRSRLHNVMDITYWNGAFVIASKSGGFTFLGLDQIGQERHCLVEDYRPGPLEISNLENLAATVYLVECFDGNLLMVLRFKAERVDAEDDDDDDDRALIDIETINFKVYRHGPGVNMDRGWEELHSLGSLAVFVGSQCTMCVNAHDVANCKGNSIYFTDDQYHICARRDMGLFDMETKTIEHFMDDDDNNRSYNCHPVWFLPRI